MGRYVCRDLDREIVKIKNKVKRETGIQITYSQAQKIAAKLMNNRIVSIRNKKNGAKIV